MTPSPNIFFVYREKDNHCKFLSVCFCVFTRQERTQAQQLRDEQDEAYYESVRADQEKVSRYNCSCFLMAFIACELLVNLFIMLYVQPLFMYS